MSIAKFGDTVKISYTGRLLDGDVFDSSEQSGPVEFTIGEGQVLPGIEHAIEGMDEGESKTVTLPADDAFGPHMDELIMRLDKGQLPDGLDPAVGEELQLYTPGGFMMVRVAEIRGAEIVLDANHPLAGQDVMFDLELLEVIQRGNAI